MLLENTTQRATWFPMSLLTTSLLKMWLMRPLARVVLSWTNAYSSYAWRTPARYNPSTMLRTSSSPQRAFVLHFNYTSLVFWSRIIPISLGSSITDFGVHDLMLRQEEGRATDNSHTNSASPLDTPNLASLWTIKILILILHIISIRRLWEIANMNLDA